MNKKLFNILLFATGAAIGSLVTWKVVKTKYEQIIQEEIDSFKETYAMCMGGKKGTQESSDEELLDEDIEYDADSSEMTDYVALTRKYNRSSNEPANSAEEGGGDDEVPYINGPYVIEPNDFANGNYDHECHCITYYADGVLADDWGVVLDIDETIGDEALKHFGDYAEDVVHVRNERLKIDYEVVQDPRNYADVMANDPLMNMHAN